MFCYSLSHPRLSQFDFCGVAESCACASPRSRRVHAALWEEATRAGERGREIKRGELKSCPVCCTSAHASRAGRRIVAQKKKTRCCLPYCLLLCRLGVFFTTRNSSARASRTVWNVVFIRYFGEHFVCVVVTQCRAADDCLPPLGLGDCQNRPRAEWELK